MSEVTSAKSGKSNKNILLIVVIILLSVAVIGGGAFAGYYLGTKNVPVVQNSSRKEDVAEAAFDVEELVLNLADENSKRFLKIKLVLAYDSKNKSFPKELEAKKMAVKDAIINVIRAKKATDLTPKGSEDLKTEIINRVNPIFSTGRLTNIYYSDFLVQ